MERRRSGTALSVAVGLEARARLALVTIARREHGSRALVGADQPPLRVTVDVLAAREVCEHWEAADREPVVPDVGEGETTPW
jgi:hypothetical protein